MQTLLVKAGLWLYYLHTCLYIYLFTVLWGTEIRTASKDNNNASSLETKQPFYVFSTPAFSSRIANASFLLLALFCPRSQCFWKAASEWTIVSILRITSVGLQLKQICSVMQTKATCFLSTESLRHDYAAPARRSVGVLPVTKCSSDYLNCVGKKESSD